MSDKKEDSGRAPVASIPPQRRAGSARRDAAAKDAGAKDSRTGAPPVEVVVMHDKPAQASGHFPVQPNIDFSQQAPVSAAPEVRINPDPETEPDDPMARLKDIVAQSSTDTAPKMPSPVAVPEIQVPEIEVTEIHAPEVEVTAGQRVAAPARIKAAASWKNWLARRKTGAGPGSQPAAQPTATMTVPMTAPAKPAGKWFSLPRRAKTPAVAHAPQRTAKQKRWARRRRRLWLEELLGWIFVPIILIGLYWAVLGLFTLLGTTPEAMISGIKQILAHF